MKRLFFLVATLCVTLAFTGETKLLRMPDVHKEKVVFVYDGDLWLASTSGGEAMRLTSDPGMELFPKFSPDGTQIAFSGEYDGNRALYVMPAEGGEPKRLTYHGDVLHHVPERMGFDNLPMDWYPDGKRILFRSRRDGRDEWVGKLFTVSVDGGLPKPLPLPEGGFASLSPDASQLAYCRIFRDFRTWKRYKGGLAQDIWIYDFGKNTIRQITHNIMMDHFPMWQGDDIYFLSDRTGRDNLYVYHLTNGQMEQLTHYDIYDAKWASQGPGAIVYEHAGDLILYDIASRTEKKLSITVPDDKQWVRPSWKSVRGKITEYDLSPSGIRALFTARGEIFTVPKKKGNTRNLTQTSGVHEKYATWSPDGQWISVVADTTGDEEIYLLDPKGLKPPQRLTTDGHCARFTPVWSPDSKRLAFADKNLTLYWLDVATKKVTKIFKATQWEIRRYGWSPDSNWITFDVQMKNNFQALFLYSLKDNKVTQVTDAFTNDYNPVFTKDGKYLLFLSDRDYSPTIGAFEFNFAYLNTTRIYALALAKDTPSLFAPQSDEEKGKSEKKEADEKKGNKKGKKGAKKSEEPKPITIDLDGLAGRVCAFPIKPADYMGLRVAKEKVYYLVNDNPTARGSVALKVYDLKKRKEKTVFSSVDGYELSRDGKVILYHSGKTYGIVDAAPGQKAGKGALNLAGLKMKVDPRAEWKQMFDEAWRLERDYYYMPNMHGLDWPSIREKYEKFLPWAAHRNDLNYLIGEMQGELATSHSYVGGGDYPKVKKVSVGLLGCDIVLDEKAGKFKIVRILKGENWHAATRSPLTEPGVNVNEGDYLLAIDGHTLQPTDNPFAYLENTVGRQVVIKVSSDPSGKGAHEETVKPIESEMHLRYVDWVAGRRAYVDKLSHGKVGYVHIPDMSFDGLNQFVRQYYSQIRKEGIIIDDRNNGGGFVSQMVLERLRRVVVGMGQSRNGAVSTYPESARYGYLACLVNHYSASDGDIFPHFFQIYKLGPVIGTRTWGGVVGIRGYSPLLDGGYITRPEFGEFNMEGKWVVENHGIDPDIVLDNLPPAIIEGKDPQLEKAVDILMKKIEEHPMVLPNRPAPFAEPKL